jgi:hypothetical protein
VRTFWILLAVVAAVALIFLLRAKSRTFREADCDCCDCCCAECCCECCPFDCCCPFSLQMFVIGVVALWGSGLTAVGWLVLSLVRS